MAKDRRSEREELARVMAKLGGVSYADELEDGAESLYPYYPEADAILEAGFHRIESSAEAEELIWEVLEPYLEGPIRLDLNSRVDNLAFGELVDAVAAAVARIQPEDAEWEYRSFSSLESTTPLSAMEEASLLSSPIRKRRRKAGEWEVAPEQKGGRK